MSLEKILSELTELVDKKLNCDGCSFFLRQFTYHGELNVQEVFPAQLFVLKESTKLHHLIGIEMFDCNEYNTIAVKESPDKLLLQKDQSS